MISSASRAVCRWAFRAIAYVAGVADVVLEQPWLARKLRRLEELGRLEAGWDGAGSRPPDPPALVAAVALVRLFSAWATLRPVCPPQIVPVAGGGLQLEWHEQGLDLEVVVGLDGGISGSLARAGGGSAEAVW